MRRIDLKRANVARPNTIRDINRQIVLNLVREREPVSRAEIARETALHRSTISIILDELSSEGLIEEASAGRSTGGRPPSLVRIRAAGPVAIGVDLGVTRTVVATSDLAGRVLEQEEFETDPDARTTLGKIAETVLRMAGGAGDALEGVGVSVPGIVDPQDGSALFVPRFGWSDLPVASRISEATGLATIVENDANATALAELWFGRPEVRGVRDFILVMINEGIGTGVMFDGQLYRGEHGEAGEFGHMTIGHGGPVACSAGSYGCWESFASERAAIARYTALAGPGAEVTFAQLLEEALAGQQPAREALAETARYLGVGISNLIKGLSPEAVIVVGPIVRAWSLVHEQIADVVTHSHCHRRSSVRIIASTLGEQPVLMGALCLVLARKFASAVTI